MPNDASRITTDSMNAVTVHVSECAVVVNKIQGGCVGLCMLAPALPYPLKTTWEKMHYAPSPLKVAARGCHPS
jgi:hypothetical protein